MVASRCVHAYNFSPLSCGAVQKNEGGVRLFNLFCDVWDFKDEVEEQIKPIIKRELSNKYHRFNSLNCSSAVQRGHSNALVKITNYVKHK
jgi:hypothetical protein